MPKPVQITAVPGGWVVQIRHAITQRWIPEKSTWKYCKSAAIEAWRIPYQIDDNHYERLRRKGLARCVRLYVKEVGK